MKACIIGAGFIAAAHAAGYEKIPQVELCGIADIRAEAARALADKHHCRAYTSALEMLQKEKPDAVSVCVPTHLHREAVCLALEQGADVLCEKPLALAMEDAIAMRDTALGCGRQVMTAQVLRFWPEYALISQKLAQKLSCSDWGPLLRLDARRIAHSSRGDWFGDPQRGGGALFDLLVHDLDFVVSILGCQAESLYATGHQNALGGWVHVNALLTWPGGIQVSLEAAGDMPLGYPFTMRFRADCENGCLDFTSQSLQNIATAQQVSSQLFCVEEGQARPLDPGTFPEGANGEAFHRQIRAFVTGVEAGRLPIPFEQSIYGMKLIHKIRASLETGCKMILDDI